MGTEVDEGTGSPGAGEGPIEQEGPLQTRSAAIERRHPMNQLHLSGV
jgi:hypothetical protein